jgi:hypothetical protein
MSEQRMVMVVPMQRAPKTRVRVRTRVGAGLCLAIIGSEECNRPVFKRGLCRKCYYRWRTERASMPAQEKAEFDAKLIQSGYLLEQHEGKVIQDESIFRRISRKSN